MAAEVVGHKQKQAWLDKVLPPVEQVQPGLWSFPVEIPIQRDTLAVGLGF